MIILGIDPGATTGWCMYDSDARRVLASGQVQEAMMRWQDVPWCDVVAVERPKGYGATRPQVVDCAWVGGQLYAESTAHCGASMALTRPEVVKALSLAIGATIRGDAAVWQALVELHGGAGVADRRAKKATKTTPAIDGGPLAGCSGHARAALAVAWCAAQK